MQQTNNVSGVHLNLFSKLALKSLQCKNINNAKSEVRFKQLIRDL
jgi:hypothetical protein